MYITLHLVDGRKITKEEMKLNWFSAIQGFTVGQTDGGELNCMQFRPIVEEDCLTVNLDHVVYMHPAEPGEIDHSKMHGW